MSDRVFVDTNVLIYAHDRDAGRKHSLAAEIVRGLWESRLGVLSVQVLQEFYVNVTRKIPSPVPRETARKLVEAYGRWHVEVADPALLIRASEVEERHSLSFWDALIIAAAARAQAGRLLSEDLQAGRRMLGLRIENPFAAGAKA